jgi:hypothetical protein
MFIISALVTEKGINQKRTQLLYSPVKNILLTPDSHPGTAGAAFLSPEVDMCMAR